MPLKEELITSFNSVNTQIKSLQEMRKNLKKLIRMADEIPQINVPETAPKKEPQKKIPITEPKPIPPQTTPKKETIFEIPFLGHTFMFYDEDAPTAGGTIKKGRGWLGVAPGQEKNFFKGCKIKAFNENDEQIKMDDREVFEVVEDCTPQSSMVKVKVI